jgi:hypothetical protein
MKRQLSPPRHATTTHEPWPKRPRTTSNQPEAVQAQIVHPQQPQASLADYSWIDAGEPNIHENPRLYRMLSTLFTPQERIFTLWSYLRMVALAHAIPFEQFVTLDEQQLASQLIQTIPTHTTTTSTAGTATRTASTSTHAVSNYHADRPYYVNRPNNAQLEFVLALSDVIVVVPPNVQRPWPAHPISFEQTSSVQDVISRVISLVVGARTNQAAGNMSSSSSTATASTTLTTTTTSSTSSSTSSSSTSVASSCPSSTTRWSSSLGNVIANGFRTQRPDGQAQLARRSDSFNATGAAIHLQTANGIECAHPNTQLNELRRRPFTTLLSRIGDALLTYLLVHCVLLIRLKNRCFVQLSGPSIAELYKAQKQQLFLPLWNDRQRLAVVPECPPTPLTPPAATITTAAPNNGQQDEQQQQPEQPEQQQSESQPHSHVSMSCIASELSTPTSSQLLSTPSTVGTMFGALSQASPPAAFTPTTEPITLERQMPTSSALSPTPSPTDDLLIFTPPPTPPHWLGARKRLRNFSMPDDSPSSAAKRLRVQSPLVEPVSVVLQTFSPSSSGLTVMPVKLTPRTQGTAPSTSTATATSTWTLSIASTPPHLFSSPTPPTASIDSMAHSKALNTTPLACNLENLTQLPMELSSSPVTPLQATATTATANTTTNNKRRANKKRISIWQRRSNQAKRMQQVQTLSAAVSPMLVLPTSLASTETNQAVSATAATTTESTTLTTASSTTTTTKSNAPMPINAWIFQTKTPSTCVTQTPTILPRNRIFYSSPFGSPLVNCLSKTRMRSISSYL